jgi:hypothetical protein
MRGGVSSSSSETRAVIWSSASPMSSAGSAFSPAARAAS